MPIERVCVVCGTKFTVSPSRLKRGDKCLYCCRTCMGKAKRKQYFVDNKEFKKAYDEFYVLMLYKAREKAENNEEIREELLSRFGIALYKNLARKNELKDWRKSFRASLNYECCQLWKDLEKNKYEIPCGIFYKDYNEYDNNCQEQRLDMKEYIKKINNTLSQSEYFIYNMSLNGVSCKQIAKAYNIINDGAVRHRIERKRKLLKKQHKEAYEYLQELDYRL